MQKNKFVAVKFANGIIGFFPLIAIAYALTSLSNKGQGMEVAMVESDVPLEFGDLSTQDVIQNIGTSSDNLANGLSLLNTIAQADKKMPQFVCVGFPDGTYGYFAQSDIPAPSLPSGVVIGVKNITLLSDIPLELGSLTKSSSANQSQGWQKGEKAEAFAQGHQPAQRQAVGAAATA